MTTRKAVLTLVFAWVVSILVLVYVSRFGWEVLLIVGVPTVVVDINVVADRHLKWLYR